MQGLATPMVPKKRSPGSQSNLLDEGLKALAKLRLAGVLMDQKNYDEALKATVWQFPPEFSSVVADRKGDVLALQEKRPEAIAEYTKAYKGSQDSVEYRRLVEIKLNALGVTLQGVTVAASNRNPCRVK